jgi:hypothetical protein
MNKSLFRENPMNEIKYILSICLIAFSAVAHSVDLTTNEVSTLSAPDIMSRPWYERFEMTGYAAAGAVCTGAGGVDPYMHLHAREVDLLVDAHSTENVLFHADWSIVPLTHEDDSVSPSVQFPELYVSIDGDLFKIPNRKLSLIIGRFAVPFGEEYLTHRSFDNSFLTTTVYYPYAYDNGIELTGKMNSLEYALAISDGSDTKKNEPSNTKSIALRLRGNASPSLFLSASYMNQGLSQVGNAAMELGGGHANAMSSSLSGFAKFQMYHLDTKYNLNSSANLKLGFGQAMIEDENSSSPDGKVDLTFFNIEPRMDITEKTFVALRYSRIQTGDSTTGYVFNGEPFAAGDNYGYISKSLSRIALATGYTLTPKAILKFEYSYDEFMFKDGTPDQADPKRWFVGTDLALKF